MPQLTDTVRALVEDEDLRSHLLRAGRAGRSAVLRPAPRPTRRPTTAQEPSHV